jgi:hypothetical protein
LIFSHSHLSLRYILITAHVLVWFCLWISNCPNTVCSVAQLNCLHIFVNNQLTKSVWMYFQNLCSVLLFSILMVIPYCLDFSVTYIKIWSQVVYKSFNFLLHFSKLFLLFWLL